MDRYRQRVGLSVDILFLSIENLTSFSKKEDPILAYSAAGEINTVQWGPIHNDWIAITYDKTLEILRV